MDWLRRVEGRQTPPGIEVRILQKLPPMTLAATLVVLALPVLARVIPAEPGIDIDKHIKSVDIFAIATEITLLAAVLTVGIGCVVVHIMKGPAFAADSLPVSHSDRPKAGGPEDANRGC